MTNKFTPGPWKLQTVSTSCGICHKIGEFPRRGKITSACVYDDYPSPGNGESKELLANAVLMSCAPELLDALRDIIGWVPGPGAWHTDGPTNSVNRARAIIKKATGAA